ncbi:MAG: hypothetical protein RL385_4822 [Pseudomonadota bacterium]
MLVAAVAAVGLGLPLLAMQGITGTRVSMLLDECRTPLKSSLVFEGPRYWYPPQTKRLFMPRIVAQHWSPAGELEVDAEVGADCEAVCFLGDYRLAADTLQLIYRPITLAYGACGEAPARLHYRIAGLARQDYRIDITQEPWSD